MSLCKNRTAQAIGECKKNLPVCGSLEQKIEILEVILKILKSSAPHTPIYNLGCSMRETGSRVLLSAKDLIPLIQKRINYFTQSKSQTEAA